MAGRLESWLADGIQVNLEFAHFALFNKCTAAMPMHSSRVKLIERLFYEV